MSKAEEQILSLESSTKKILSKDLKDEYPTIEDMMFGNKEAIKKSNKKKKYKEWQNSKRS